jgi:hypothetical protein
MVLRVVVILFGNPQTPHTYGGDAVWFMVYGYGYFTFDEFGAYSGYPFTTSNIPTPPLYLIFVGGWLHLMATQELAVMMIWLVQVLMGVATCYLAYRITLDVTQNQKAAWLVLTLHVFSPPMLLDVRHIMTEPMYTFFIYAGIWAYVRMMVIGQEKPYRWAIVAGLALGLATLTRAVSLMFPLGLFLHAIITTQGGNWRRGLRVGLLLMVTYAGMVGTWTAHNWFYFERFVIASDQFMPAVWRGTVDLGISPQESDALLGDATPQEQVTATIGSDPMGYVQQRATQLISAVAEPYSVAFIGGDVNMRALIVDWLRNPLDIDKLWSFAGRGDFWLQVVIYGLHYLMLLGAPIGLWIMRKRWQFTSVLLGFIVYTLLLHFVTLAIPRYIFPTYSALWILASPALVALGQDIAQRLSHRWQEQSPQR